MAKENIRNDPPPLPPDEQFSEILLVMDKKELTVRAVSEIDKDGKAKTVPADEKNQNSFCKTDYNANILSNFFTNFWSQLNDPTRFRFFKLNIGKFKEFNNVLKDYINGHNTPEVKKFLEQYEIKSISTIFYLFFQKRKLHN